MKVKNPKTTAQTLPRVLVKVVALAYAMMKAICNHSFEGVTNGFECMNKFKKVNLRYLRERAATLQSLGQSLNQFYQSCRFRVRSGVLLPLSSQWVICPRSL